MVCAVDMYVYTGQLIYTALVIGRTEFNVNRISILRTIYSAYINLCASVYEGYYYKFDRSGIVAHLLVPGSNIERTLSMALTMAWGLGMEEDH